MKITQHDESGAGGKASAEGYDMDEAQKIITTKLKERISLQQNLRYKHLKAVYALAELKEIEHIHDMYDPVGKAIIKDKEYEGHLVTWKQDGVMQSKFIDTKGKEHHDLQDIKWTKTPHKPLSYSRRPQWFGISMPKRLLVHTYDLLKHDWKNIMWERNNMIQNLQSLGFSKVHITGVMEKGKYIKDLKQLEQMEKDYNDKRFEGAIDGTKGEDSGSVKAKEETSKDKG